MSKQTRNQKLSATRHPLKTTHYLPTGQAGSLITSSGYAVLMTVLIVGAVGLTISISLILLGVGFSNSGFSLEKSAMAKYYADACAENALQAIWDTDFVGTGNLNFSRGDCLYEVIDGGGDNRTIQSTGVSGSVTRRIKISLDQLSPTVNVTTWEDVASF